METEKRREIRQRRINENAQERLARIQSLLQKNVESVSLSESSSTSVIETMIETPVEASNVNGEKSVESFNVDGEKPIQSSNVDSEKPVESSDKPIQSFKTVEPSIMSNPLLKQNTEHTSPPLMEEVPLNPSSNQKSFWIHLISGFLTPLWIVWNILSDEEYQNELQQISKGKWYHAILYASSTIRNAIDPTFKSSSGESIAIPNLQLVILYLHVAIIKYIFHYLFDYL